jgi:hypothetical protein
MPGEFSDLTIGQSGHLGGRREGVPRGGRVLHRSDRSGFIALIGLGAVFGKTLGHFLRNVNG